MDSQATRPPTIRTLGNRFPIAMNHSPDDPDAQVRVAIHKVIGLALHDRENPIIQRDAAKALDLGGG